MQPVTSANAWRRLALHHRAVHDLHLRDLFAADPARGERLTAEAAGLLLDYSKHRITDETLALLVALARERGVREAAEAMFRGDPVNVTEERPALHVALRMPRARSLLVDGRDVVRDVHDVLDRMGAFVEAVRSGAWTGATGLPLRNVVNVGIGGSDLGPAMAHGALRAYARRDLRCRFVSNVDGTEITEATRDLDPAETLVVVVSKTFTTLETMTNAHAARRWLVEGLGGDETAVSRHFVAVSTNLEEVARFGIDRERAFGFWDWVGGRYSLCSAVGLSTMIAVGPERFAELLAGFHALDEHFLATPFEHNLPVLMGLLGVWYGDFFGAQTVAVVPYDRYLDRFPAYLQQLTMESNGKSVTGDGRAVDAATGPVYWGAPGTNGQHSFFQLLHQGTHVVPCDFVAFAAPLHELPVAGGGDQHDLLIANMLAQAEALAFGRSAEQARAEGTPEELVPHRVCDGNRPSSAILAERLTPFSLGTLIALYEHVVFTQAAIWGTNPFDQWGVELGKQLAGRIAPELVAPEGNGSGHDSSTRALIRRYRRARGRR